jgi:hypothetical protein
MQLGYTGEAEWRPEASSRGDAKQPKQPRRCAGRQAGAHRRGEDSPLPFDEVSGSRGAYVPEFLLLKLELCRLMKLRVFITDLRSREGLQLP